MRRIDILLLSESDLGKGRMDGCFRVIRAEVASVAVALNDWLTGSTAEALLVWDCRLGAPPGESALEILLSTPADCWHAGLRLGTVGLPRLMDMVRPNWMLVCDPDAGIEATSWRLSLRACLLRREVLGRLGGLSPGFRTLDAAALELGHRYIVQGALIRHVPWLVSEASCADGAGSRERERDLGSRNARTAERSRCPNSIGGLLFGLGRLGAGKQSLETDGSRPLPVTRSPEVRLPLEDELRFIHLRFGKTWLKWAAMRALVKREASVRQVVAGLGAVVRCKREPDPPALRVCQIGCVPTPVGPAQRSHGSGTPSREGAREGTPRCSPGAARPAIEGFPRVSVLIPTVDRYPYLRTLLNQLRSQTIAPTDIIVVDQTHPDHRDGFLASEFPDLPLKVIVQDEPGQCSSRNAGIRAARGDYVLFLDDDVEVNSNLIELHWSSQQEFRAGVSSGVAHEPGTGPMPEDFTRLRVSDVFPTGNTMVHREVLARSGLFDLAYNRGQRADGDLGMRVYLSGAMMILDPRICVLHHRAPAGGLRLHKARTVTYAGSRSRINQRQILTSTDIYKAYRYFGVERTLEMLWLNVLGTFSCHGSRVRRAAKVVVSALCLVNTLRLLRRRVAETASMLARYPDIPELLPGTPAPGVEASDALRAR